MLGAGDRWKTQENQHNCASQRPGKVQRLVWHYTEGEDGRSEEEGEETEDNRHELIRMNCKQYSRFDSRFKEIEGNVCITYTNNHGIEIIMHNNNNESGFL